MTDERVLGESPARTRANDDALAPKVSFLQRPSSYREPTETVETVETHFAYVFLCDRLVYKLKKPVRYGQVDHTTAAARRASCELEVTLNRRLAGPVYLGVVPLTVSNGTFELDGLGEAIDWLVKMRRLPRERTLEAMARRGEAQDAHLRALIHKLDRFYRSTAVAPWSPARYRQRLMETAFGTAQQLSRPELGIDPRAIGGVYEAQQRFLRDRADILEARVHSGRVVDAHGDLRPEHVFFDSEPQIIDCLEFSQELRFLDTAEEMSFLALECERLGMSDIGKRLIHFYIEIAGDDIDAQTLAFYRSLRAMTRALLSAWRTLEEARDGDAAQWAARTDWYVRHAELSLRPRTGR